MKNVLGSFLFLVFVSINLYATTYTWSAYANKKEAYVNETIYLKYVCKFSDRGELYAIEFHPEQDNDTYSVELLSKTSKIENFQRINTYEYIAYVKKPMVANFEFEAVMKKTNQDSIENTVLGRDNADYEEFATTTFKQENIEINIKETQTDLVGELSMEVHKDDGNIKAYEPYHLDVKISGVGNIDQIQAISFNIDGVKVFTQEPILKITHTKDGHEGSWRQKFAFVGSENFTIPEIKIEYFDLKTQKLHDLTVASTDVIVNKVYKKEDLLDPVEENIVSSWFKIGYLYYVLTFIAGFLVAKIEFKKKKLSSKDELFVQKVKNAKTLEALTMLLILNDDKRFKNALSEIERNSSISLQAARRKVLELLL